MPGCGINLHAVLKKNGAFLIKRCPRVSPENCDQLRQLFTIIHCCGIKGTFHFYGAIVFSPREEVFHGRFFFVCNSNAEKKRNARKDQEKDKAVETDIWAVMQDQYILVPVAINSFQFGKPWWNRTSSNDLEQCWNRTLIWIEANKNQIKFISLQHSHSILCT